LSPAARAEEIATRKGTLSDRPLDPAEERAVLVAAAWYPVGSEEYHGAKEGFLVGYAARAGERRNREKSVAWLKAYLHAWNRGRTEYDLDVRRVAAGTVSSAPLATFP
jgi:hypothetical protein